MGRGGLANNHVGNNSFRILTASMKPEYARLPKDEKTDVSRRLLHMVHARGGRFLAKDPVSGLFYEVENKTARRKCSQALREESQAERAARKSQKAAEAQNDEDDDDSEDEEEEEDSNLLSDALSPGRYKYVPMPPGGTNFVQNGDIVVTLFTTGWERGKVEGIAEKATPSQKRVARGFSVPRLVRYVSDWSYWLHDLDNPSIYLSKKQFNNFECW